MSAAIVETKRRTLPRKDAVEALQPSCQTNHRLKDQVSLVEAPKWLARRMDALRQMPPPSLSEVDRQWASSAATRRRLIEKPSASSSGQNGAASS